LYGLLPPKEQQEAIAPSPPGSRKVVLATPIAETSLTIEGVRVVVDGGLCRQPVYDPRSGLSTLQTVRISRDMATQRTGRAGRVAPGVCYRLWSAATEARMAECRQPEILQADLSGVVLDLAAWGASNPASLPWLTPPPAASLSAAFSLLRQLGALDESLHITRVGHAMAELPCHPRIAHMLVRAETPVLKALACDIAALLEEKDPLAGTASGDLALGPSSVSADLCLRLSALREARSRGNARGVWSRLIRIAEQYRRLVRVPADDTGPDPFDVGALLAAAYPERVAKAVEGAFGVYALASGERAAIDGSDALAAYDWLSVASVFVRAGAPGRIFLAAPLSPEVLPSLAVPYDNIAWDARKGILVARRERRIGTLTVSSQPLGTESREAAMHVLCEAASKEGASMFDWSDAVQGLSRRIATVAAWHPELGLPELDAEAVFSRAGEWLPALAARATTAAELRKIDLCPVLWGLLSYEQQRAVDRLAPSHIVVPTGSRIAVEYRQGSELPILRVRLQECFGLLDTPRVDDGRRPVLMELLSPGYKPVQLTTDLASFWRDTYFEVRKELRRRYPKHAWPDDPIAAAPVRGVRRK
jgi:ATP-dependent helicase HrpB